MTSPASVVIADDEPLARANLRHLLEPRGDVEIVAECRTGRQTIEVIRGTQPDIALLDIRMPDGGGMDALRALEVDERPITLLMTAHPEHAFEAYQLGVLDYVVKPFEDARFHDAVSRAVRLLNGEHARAVVERLALLGPSAPQSAASATPAGRDDGAPMRRRFLVQDGERSLVVAAAEVLWIEGDGAHAVLHTARGTHRVRLQMQQLESELDPREFVRVHRSVIVRIDQIAELYPYFHGDYEMRLRCGARVRLSRRRVGVLDAILRV